MEIRGHLPRGEDVGLAGLDILAVLPAVMNCARDAVGMIAQTFHHVDFAVVRFTAVRRILRQHPERRPETRARRQFGAKIKAPVSLVEKPLRHDLARGIGKSVGILPLRHKVQKAVRNVHILRAAGIILQFAFAPPVDAVADLIDPLVRIERGAVEFVAPHDVRVGPGERWHGTPESQQGYDGENPAPIFNPLAELHGLFLSLSMRFDGRPVQEFIQDGLDGIKLNPGAKATKRRTESAVQPRMHTNGAAFPPCSLTSTPAPYPAFRLVPRELALRSRFQRFRWRAIEAGRAARWRGRDRR